MKQILTFVDLTRVASNAVAQAASFAAMHDAHLTICHIKPDASEESQGQIREKMQGYASQVEAKGVSFELCICNGELFDQAKEMVKLIQPDLTVVGTRGAAGVSLSTFGSAIHKLVREVDIHCLVIGDACTPVDGGFEKIVVPVGGQSNFLEGVAHACELRSDRGEIILYAIVPLDGSLTTSALENVEKAKELLDARGVAWQYIEEIAKPHAVGNAQQTLSFMRKSKFQVVVIPSEIAKHNKLFGKLDKDALLLNEFGIQILCVNGEA